MMLKKCMIVRLVLLCIIYSLNKGVNGTRFSNPKDLMEFSNKNDNAFNSEIFYDSSFFMKCEFYFKN